MRIFQRIRGLYIKDVSKIFRSFDPSLPHIGSFSILNVYNFGPTLTQFWPLKNIVKKILENPNFSYFLRNQVWDHSLTNYRIRGLVNGRTTIVFDLVNNTLFWDNFPFRWFDICLIIDNNVTSLTLKIDFKSCFRHQVAFKSVLTSPLSSLEG